MRVRRFRGSPPFFVLLFFFAAVQQGAHRPPAKAEFTNTHSSVLDGETYRVSMSEAEADAALSRDGYPAPSAPHGGAREASGSNASSTAARSAGGSEGGGELEEAGEAVTPRQ